MSRYQGRHRSQTPPIWRDSRVTVPVVAAAGITLTAAGVAQGAPSAKTAADTSLSQPKTVSASVVNRVDLSATSRSRARAAAQVKQATAKRAASQKAAAAKLAADKQAAQKKAALAALSSTPAAKQLTVTAPESTQSSRSSSATSRGSAVRDSTTSAFVCPIAGCGGRFTSGFGARSSPGGIGSTNHKGDDFATPIGTPLRAVHSGTVVAVGWYGGFGMRVEIDLGGGTSVIYGHMSAFSATVGEQVSPGEVIGYSGNTGNSTGPHLHFEVHIGGVAVDPGPWMRARGIF
ncbi:murein DD-endopeptidase MepM/ murein hydrolase activator NlpD [Branchiibius hedensis]|uniref:Murein DD-endopeptidase MepM and murein hydrolase activator NlpD, contain LysM domain n=1 Tax=Branchiibius hedensis TaxID=672460 RepID=A0A2Y8ZTZ5_9MICO|nr:M23 family metallopeptidase [Branchiibius hedensis]PWJ26164.1 murein DD-endopeptidase MepM/ murein hydrolase activator NlpD [Branchiibius hedensis]SSA34976.1 Murein DD-endopeptidase MepM and murein hydrolase activator NlpD, contain LysM domain [Branchiibius hedensis]